MLKKLKLNGSMKTYKPGSSIHGIFQARVLEWGAIAFSNAWKWKSESEVGQLCLTLWDPMDCSLPGSSVHGIFQAIVLEWIAISFSRGSSRPRDPTQVSFMVDRRFTVWATREVQWQLKQWLNWLSRHCLRDVWHQRIWIHSIRAHRQ